MPVVLFGVVSNPTGKTLGLRNLKPNYGEHAEFKMPTSGVRTEPAGTPIE